MADKKKVLVVDDDPDFLDSVATLLKRAGYTVVTGYDGEEAVAKAKAEQPDAMVLDVMMPKKDGYQACGELKADPDTEEIPILLLTAVASHVSTTSYSHQDGMNTEADDYLDKGCEPAEIVERVEELLED